MEIIEIKRRLMSFVGGMVHPDTNLSNYKFDENIVEHIKDSASLEERKKEYEALQWANQNPNFDFRTCWHEKIPFSKKEVFDLLMKMKAFYEVEEYELLTDNRKPKEGWEF